MMDIILLLFFQKVLICMDEKSARELAQAIVYDKDYTTPNCGFVTGTVVEEKRLPTAYFATNGMGIRVTKGTYLGKTVYFFLMEYSI